MKSTDLAKQAYEAYGDEAGWTIYGKKMPLWEELTVKVRNNWRASATKVARLLGFTIDLERES